MRPKPHSWGDVCVTLGTRLSASWAPGSLPCAGRSAGSCAAPCPLACQSADGEGVGQGTCEASSGQDKLPFLPAGHSNTVHSPSAPQLDKSIPKNHTDPNKITATFWKNLHAKKKKENTCRPPAASSKDCPSYWLTLSIPVAVTTAAKLSTTSGFGCNQVPQNCTKAQGDPRAPRDCLREEQMVLRARLNKQLLIHLPANLQAELLRRGSSQHLDRVFGVPAVQRC